MYAPEAVLFVFAGKHDIKRLKQSHAFQYITLENCPTNESLGCYDESYAYLEFVVRNYWKLPEKLVFVHGHSRSWHYSSPLETRLQYIATSTYFAKKDESIVTFCANSSTIRRRERQIPSLVTLSDTINGIFVYNLNIYRSPYFLPRVYRCTAAFKNPRLSHQ